MADGYARVSGSVGVATVHQGPGLTNTLTALTEAARSRTPLVLIAAETTAGNQALDQVGAAAGVGAVAVRMRHPTDAVEAYRRARDERRPVVLNLPVDVLKGEAEAPSVVLPTAPEAHRPTGEDVELLAEALAVAARPLILAGRGALGAGPALAAVAEASGALLATTAAAHGLFAGHPRSLGIAGGFAAPPARRLLDEADLVLVFGASLNRWTTVDGALFSSARIVRVDTEEPADVIADAAAVAKALGARELHGRGFPEPAPYDRRDEIDDRSRSGLIDPRTLMVALDDLLPDDRAVAIDSGHFMGWPAMYLPISAPDQFVMAQAFQSVGLGLATGIGAAVARPDRVTAAFIGDGGARMSLMELDTAVRLGVPLLVVVVNDSGYGAEVHDFEPLGVDVELARFPDVDFAAVARGLGANAATVRRREDLEPVRDWAVRPEAPLLLDCKVNPEVAADW
jgi:thiamine pyrophosphate-dependent acetolactate synthase large subunit-like protein